MNDHAFFVVLSYGVAFLVIGGMALRIVLDYRRLREELARLGAAASDREDGA
jgi:heme exporter protein D